mgnify:CR=1 FL=1
MRQQLASDESPGLLLGSLPILAVVAAMALAVFAVDSALVDVVPAGRWGAALRVPAGMLVGLVTCVLGARRLCPDVWDELAGLWSRD